jgi:hypothetical protein
MSNDTLAQRIDLLQDQINNLEKSGHFTEKEMDSQSFPLRQELESLKRQLYSSNLDESLGITAKQMSEGRRVFNELWAKIDALKNPIFNIEVIDAEILTPNHITA